MITPCTTVAVDSDVRAELCKENYSALSGSNSPLLTAEMGSTLPLTVLGACVEEDSQR